MRKVLACLALVVSVPVAVADAQTVQRPTRPFRGLFGGGAPPDPNRTRHELTLTSSLLGGYDDVISPNAVPSPIEPNQIQQSGFSGFLDATLRYWYGRQARSISIEGTGITSTYTNIDVGSTAGAYVRLRAETDLGRRHRIMAAQDFSLEPTLVMGGFVPLLADPNAPVPPESGGASGFVNQRSRSTRTSASLTRDWSPRQGTTLTYTFFRQTYLDDFGIDNAANTLGLEHSWAVSRTNSLDASYGLSRTELTDQAGLVTPLTDQRFEAGFTHQRRLSPTRNIQLTGGAGATHVQTLNTADRSDLAYWVPSGYARMSLDLGRSWALFGSYRRAVTALAGVTVESFATDAAEVGANGVVARRFEVAMAAAFSNGSAGGADAASRFQIYTGMAQLRYALARCCALSGNYNYYFYKSSAVVLPTGFPPTSDRNAVRVGLTLLLPLVGSSTAGPGRPVAGGR
jgi:hypothetical protein